MMPRMPPGTTLENKAGCLEAGRLQLGCYLEEGTAVRQALLCLAAALGPHLGEHAPRVAEHLLESTCVSRSNPATWYAALSTVCGVTNHTPQFEAQKSTAFPSGGK